MTFYRPSAKFDDDLPRDLRVAVLADQLERDIDGRLGVFILIDYVSERVNVLAVSPEPSWVASPSEEEHLVEALLQVGRKLEPSGDSQR